MCRRQVFPQLFQVLPNFHDYFYTGNLIETRRTGFFISVRKHCKEKKENLLTLIIKMYIIFARTIITSTARASSVSPSSYRNMIFK